MTLHTQYCTYCQYDKATDRDHVVPKSYSGTTSFRDNTVPACKECNGLLSNHPVHTVEDRTAFLYEAYYKKYKKALSAPLWTKDEIKELGGTLKAHVVKEQRKKLMAHSKLQNLKKQAGNLLKYTEFETNL